VLLCCSDFFTLSLSKLKVGLILFLTCHEGKEGRWRYSSIRPQHRRYFEVIGKLHTRATLPLGSNPRTHWWFSEPVWTWLEMRKPAPRRRLELRSVQPLALLPLEAWGLIVAAQSHWCLECNCVAHMRLITEVCEYSPGTLFF
jgi:hypothetical protein